MSEKLDNGLLKGVIQVFNIASLDAFSEAKLQDWFPNPDPSVRDHPAFNRIRKSLEIWKKLGKWNDSSTNTLSNHNVRSFISSANEFADDLFEATGEKGVSSLRVDEIATLLSEILEDNYRSHESSKDKEARQAEVCFIAEVFAILLGIEHQYSALRSKIAQSPSPDRAIEK